MSGAVGEGRLALELPASEGWSVEQAEVVFVAVAPRPQLTLERAERDAESGLVSIDFMSSRPLAVLPRANHFALEGEAGVGRTPHLQLSRLDAYRFRVRSMEAVSTAEAVRLVFQGGGEDHFGLSLSRGQFDIDEWTRAEAEAPAEEPLAARVALPAAEVTIPLALTETPAGSGFLTAFANGSLNTGGSEEAHNYQLELESGDELSVYTNAIETSPTSRLQLYDPSGTQVLGGYNGSPYPIQRYAIETPGTYRVRFWTDGASDFEFRADVGRGQSLEVETNNSVGEANSLRFSAISGGYQARVAGALAALDSNSWFGGSNDTQGDYFNLGTINAGNAVDVTYALPSGSSLEAGDLQIALYRDGEDSPVKVSTAAAGLSHTATVDGAYFAQVGINDNLDGTSLRFAGETDRVDLPAAVLDGAEALTVEFWLRGRPDGRGVLSAAHAGESNEFLLYLLNSTTVRLHDRGPSFDWTVPPIDEATWRHYAVVRDPIAGTLELFVDGDSMGTKATTLPALTVEHLVLGQDQDTVGGGYQTHQAFIGHLDDLRVWSVARSASEIQDNRSAVLNGDESDLTAYWRFNEGSGTVASDETVQQYDGTLVGPEFVGDVGAAGFNPAKLGLRAQYLATVTVSDAIAPTLVATTLPDPENEGFYTSFGVEFSEDMDPVTVAEASAYTLIEAGADGSFGTADDDPYALEVSTYTLGREVTLNLLDGPMQPGLYRFTASASLTDRAGNPLMPYSVDFTLNQLGDFIIENRANDTFAEATPLAAQLLPAHDGTFTLAETWSAVDGGGLELIDLNADGALDAVVLDYAGNAVAVYLNDGQGAFTYDASYGMPDDPVFSVTGDFDGDGREDLAVSVRDDDELRIFFNEGDGTLRDGGAIAVGDGP
ncbi:MAG: LamG-like jellyroll fold domain-containing protein, partial [Opitutales bacterium]